LTVSLFPLPHFQSPRGNLRGDVLRGLYPVTHNVLVYDLE